MRTMPALNTPASSIAFGNAYIIYGSDPERIFQRMQQLSSYQSGQCHYDPVEDTFAGKPQIRYKIRYIDKEGPLDHLRDYRSKESQLWAKARQESFKTPLECYFSTAPHSTLDLKQIYTDD